MELRAHSNGLVFAHLLLAAMLNTFVVAGATAEVEILPYPNAELVTSKLEAQANSHELMLGPLKKINNQMSAELEKYVRGLRKVEIHYLPDESRTRVVADFYQQQIDSAGVSRYRCSGRECGDSNDWANAVFGERILFGLSEDQHYFVSEVNSDYVIIYVTKRATGKVYVYTEILTPDNSKQIDSEVIFQSLQADGRYVLPPVIDAALVSEIARLLKENKSLNLLVVGHEAKTRKSDLATSISRSEQQARKVTDALRASNIESSQVQPKGVGFLAPSARQPGTRLELIVN
ncbi:MAG: outer membrane protein OmpA-like peptidoglycan-associated protein [Candidatus Azotimanducaceae bacterium]|jgi:outer membrane protein OmpA-like peptidoglycan-associated protein